MVLMPIMDLCRQKLGALQAFSFWSLAFVINVACPYPLLMLSLWVVGGVISARVSPRWWSALCVTALMGLVLTVSLEVHMKERGDDPETWPLGFSTV
jgi:hypothetical protein